MRAGLYIRVSTEEQSVKGYSVPEQTEACKKKAKELGATEFMTFIEEGESGAFIDRPKLEKLLEAVRNNEIQLVIALDTDRLARDLGTQIVVAKEIEEYARLDFVYYSRGNPDNPEDNLFFHIKGAFSQYDRAKIKRNTSSGRKRKALSGQVVIPGGWTGHPGPYGYKYIKSYPSRLEIVEEEAEIIRYIYQLAHEGMGILSIVETLNNQGIPSPKGSIWHGSTVGRILKNETYAGVFYNLKYRCTLTNQRTINGKRKVQREVRPIEERIPVKVPAIIERSVWEEVQAGLKERAVKNQKVGSFFLLKGRVKCGLCGKTCASETSGKISPVTNSRRTYYRCKGTKTGALPKCTLPTITSITNSLNTGLDDVIWAEITKVINNPKIIEKHLDNLREKDIVVDLRKQIKIIEKKLLVLEKQKEEMLNLRLESLLTAEELKNRLLKIKEKENRLKAELNDLQKSITSFESIEIDAVEFCQYFQERIKNASNDIKHQVITDLNIKVIAHSNKSFEMHWPFQMTTEVNIEEEKYTHSSPVSMTPEMKKVIDTYQEPVSDIIRKAIREVSLKEHYVKTPRSKRFRSTVLLTEKDMEKLTLIKQKYDISYSQAVEWALRVFLES